MGNEIDLLAKYPKAKRDLTQRLESKTEEVRSVARKFDKEFFDGERKFGYGGFSYNSRYWSEVVKDFSNYYNLNDGSRILDVGCAKGFMLYDFYKLNSKKHRNVAITATARKMIYYLWHMLKNNKPYIDNHISNGVSEAQAPPLCPNL